MERIANPYQDLYLILKDILERLDELPEIKKEMARIRARQEAEVLLTNQEAAELLGVHVNSIHRMRKDGRIAYAGPGIKKYRKVDLLTAGEPVE